MIKRLFLITLLITIAATLSGCGGSGSSASSTPDGVNQGVASRVQLMATSYVNQTNSFCYFKTKVIDGNGRPMKNMQVIFTNLSLTGVLDHTTASTDSNGIATATLYSTTAGFATVQAEVNTGTEIIRDRKTVFFSLFDLAFPTAPQIKPALVLDVDSDNDGVYNEPTDFIMFEPAGKTDAIIRATVTGSSGAPVLNSAVTFGSDSPEVTFPLGSSITAPVVHTNSLGQASVLARVSPLILRSTGSTVNITAAADNSTFNVVTLFLMPVNVNTVTVAANPPTVPSASTSSITATVKTTAGNPVPDNTVVNFSTTSGTIVPFASTSGGVATAVFTAPVTTVNTAATITASVGGKSGSAVVTVTGAPITFTIIPDAQTIANPAVGNTKIYNILGGTAPYTAFSNNPAYATASVTGNKVTATVASVPSVDTTVTISVFDAIGDSKSVTLILDVPPIVPTVPILVTPTTQTVAAPYTPSTYTISGGTPGFTAFSGNPALVSVGVVGSTLTATVNAPYPTADTTVAITVYDSVGGSAPATLIVKGSATLKVTPTTRTVAPPTGAPYTYTISGGTPGYAAFSSNPALVSVGVVGATLTATVNTPYPTADTTVTITVYDSVSATTTATLTVQGSATLKVTPTTRTVPPAASSYTYTISGGTAGYTVFSSNPGMVSAGVVGTTLTATVTGPFPTTDTTVIMTVYDSLGATTTATLIVKGTAALSVTPTTRTVPPAAAFYDYTISGGTPVYTAFSSNPGMVSVSIVGGTTLRATVAGPFPTTDTTVTMTVYDSLGASTPATLIVKGTATLSVTPASVTLTGLGNTSAANTVTFTVTGGTGSGNYSMFSDNTAVIPSTGPFGGSTFAVQPATVGADTTVTLTVVDTAGATKTVTVIVKPLSIGLKLNPSSISVTVGDVIPYYIFGGAPPYTNVFSSDNSCTTIIGTGPSTFTVTANSCLTAPTITVEDSAGATATATITIN